MIDRVGEVYEWEETGEIFLILGQAYCDNFGDIKWNAVIIHEATLVKADPYEKIGDISTYSEMWFSDSTYSWKVRRLSGAPQERREGY